MPLCACGRAAKLANGRCERCSALDVLELESNASSSEINEAYRTLVKVWHPDRFQNDTVMRGKTGKKLAEINAAHQYLLKEPAPSTGNASSTAPQYEHPKYPAYDTPGPAYSPSSPRQDPMMQIGKTISLGSLVLLLIAIVIGVTHMGSPHTNSPTSKSGEALSQPVSGRTAKPHPGVNKPIEKQEISAEEPTLPSEPPLDQPETSSTNAEKEKTQGHVAPIVRIDPNTGAVSYPQTQSAPSHP